MVTEHEVVVAELHRTELLHDNGGAGDVWGRPVSKRDEEALGGSRVQLMKIWKRGMKSVECRKHSDSFWVDSLLSIGEVVQNIRQTDGREGYGD